MITEETDPREGCKVLETFANTVYSAGGRQEALSTQAKQEASKVEDKVSSLVDQAKDKVKGS